MEKPTLIKNDSFVIESVPLTEKEKVKYLYKEVPIIKEVHKFVEQPTFVRNNEFIIESIPMDKLDKVDKIKDKKLEEDRKYIRKKEEPIIKESIREKAN